MKLLPAVLFIIAIFLSGLLFLEGRRTSRMALFVPIAIANMLLLSGILYMLVGKIALLLVVIGIVIFLIYSRIARITKKK